MRARRLVRGLIIPFALLALVATLGTLQYRWLGQVSEAEREQLRESLTRRAREFADDFDRAITNLYQGLQPASPIDPASPEAFAARYDRWIATAPAPAIVKGVYFTKVTASDSVLYRYDPAGRTFAVTDWPASLTPVRESLSGSVDELPGRRAGSAPTKVITLTGTPILADVPAVVIPVPIESTVSVPAPVPGVRLDHDILMALRMVHSQLVVELDAGFVSSTFLPALITRHFSESGTVRYRVAVVNGEGRPLASRNLAEPDRLNAERADVTAPFFALRPEIVRSATLTWTMPADQVSDGTSVLARPLSAVTNQFSAVAVTPVPRSGVLREGNPAGAVGGPIAVRVSTGHWRVLVQHDAGSLDAAVGAARRRNLWLSFGILAVLAAGAGLIVINARRSERLAAQQMDFVATVSHELRTPLAVIRSAGQNLSAGVVHEADQARRYGELIETEGRRLTDMVEQVLEYAGLEGNRRNLRARLTDPGRLVEEAVSSFAALFEADGLDVTTAVAPDLPPVAVDEDAVRRAVNNLLTNAVKYAASGRTIDISVRSAPARGHREVQIAVSDHGPGIEAEDLAHIFEPFYRGRNASERQIHGNGLGLSLVKRIAEAHGGRVTVKSTPGAGATFTLHLPAAQADAAVQPLEPAPDAGGVQP